MSVPFKVDLAGKVAVVTGGGGVLCSVMALALAECGAKVVVLSRRQESVDKAAAEIRAAGFEAAGVACDVLDRPGLEAAREKILQLYGTCDILINGAGGNHPKGTTSKEYLLPDDLRNQPEGTTSFFDLTAEGIQSVFNLNFLGTMLPTQVFAKDMALKGSGCIINVSSMSGFKPLTKIPAYSGAKAAVNNFTQWLAVHFSQTGVRVNAIAPGFFLTNQNRALLTTPDGGMTPRGQTIVAHTPQRHYGKPQDLVGALLWLVSDEASGFVTGTVIAVDGGFNAFSGV